MACTTRMPSRTGIFSRRVRREIQITCLWASLGVSGVELVGRRPSLMVPSLNSGDLRDAARLSEVMEYRME